LGPGAGSLLFPLDRKSLCYPCLLTGQGFNRRPWLLPLILRPMIRQFLFYQILTNLNSRLIMANRAGERVLGQIGGLPCASVSCLSPVEDALSRKGLGRGTGLDSMRERTELVGGMFTIESMDSGTVIQASWPL